MTSRVSRRALLVAVAAFAAAAAGLAIADWRTPPRGEGPETIPVKPIDGTGYVAVNDLARLLDATKFWRPEVRRLVLRAGAHNVTMTADNPFVIVDETTVWMGAPVRSVGGELQVPVTLVDALPRDSTIVRLFHDVRRRRVVVLPASGGVGSPRTTVTPDVTRLVFAADRPEEALVIARSRAHFRVRFGGFFTGALPDTFPAHSLVRSAKLIAASGGTAFELEIAPDAAGFRLVQNADARRVTLEIARARGPELEAFAPESPPGPRVLRVIVLDPGHGGEDPGVLAHGAVEKDLALELARLLKPELERSVGARVLLTRTDDQAVTAEARAEIANRAHADLVLSLHFDGFSAGQARGATGYCPPATYGASAGRRSDAGEAPSSPSTVSLLPWRDVASRHAVASRSLAEAVLSALELRGQGPTRLRERMPYDLLGVNAPGMLLECATLTSAADRERVTQDEGLRELAASIAAGVSSYQRLP